MILKVKRLSPQAKLPQYQSEAAAGADLYACCEVTIAPMQRVRIPTGIAIECERDDVAAIISARSGLSAKHGITLANGIGVVDSDYRGEILVSVVNLSNEEYTVRAGERIAQLLLVPVLRGRLVECDELSETKRGSGGFGSTG